MRMVLVGVRLVAVGVSLMRLVVKKSMHGSLLLLKSTHARMHVGVSPRVKAPVLLPVHVHVESEHRRLV